MSDGIASLSRAMRARVVRDAACAVAARLAEVERPTGEIHATPARVPPDRVTDVDHAIDIAADSASMRPRPGRPHHRGGGDQRGSYLLFGWPYVSCRYVLSNGVAAP